MLDDHRRRIWLIVFPIVLALAATLSAVAANAIGVTQQRERAERWHVHTLEVLLATGALNTTIHAALRGERGYLLTGDRTFLRPYLAARRATADLLKTLRLLTADNKRQQASVAQLEVRLRDYLQLLEKTVALADSGKLPQAVALVRSGAGRTRVEALLEVLRRIEAEEYRLLSMRRSANERVKAESEQVGHALLAIGGVLLLLLICSSVAALKANDRAKRATEELRRLATTDELTTLANRRFFLDALERERARASRSGNPLCLALVDLDHFKQINDRHGHPAGDEVLRNVARILGEGTRTSDIVGRIGGEEFAILMPETAWDQALSVCERLCAAMERTPMALSPGLNAAVTLSSGIALLAEGESSSQLISRADAALYNAKFHGRNQVKLAA